MLHLNKCYQFRYRNILFGKHRYYLANWRSETYLSYKFNNLDKLYMSNTCNGNLLFKLFYLLWHISSFHRQSIPVHIGNHFDLIISNLRNYMLYNRFYYMFGIYRNTSDKLFNLRPLNIQYCIHKFLVEYSISY